MTQSDVDTNVKKSQILNSILIHNFSTSSKITVRVMKLSVRLVNILRDNIVWYMVLD